MEFLNLGVDRHRVRTCGSGFLPTDPINFKSSTPVWKEKIAEALQHHAAATGPSKFTSGKRRTQRVHKESASCCLWTVDSTVSRSKNASLQDFLLKSDIQTGGTTALVGWLHFGLLHFQQARGKSFLLPRKRSQSPYSPFKLLKPLYRYPCCRP